ncbi:hypothetical protein L211DRAFT_807714 [Terfezia boudieri ATCC MYA-4762]|uniref:Zn(2)-C6 fungal-type domain-containing protein n=1 Tax=Terfezia boudieri ATCC MYA-4762 TaxID=1051890 RepID=A0A3N4M2F7_9PEZI|nr:hypothetical protein L211DRAFT_807714 [Terfezia boudieri ATCC MYA-4762]
MDHNHTSPVAPSQQQDRGIKRSYPASSISSSPTAVAGGGAGISTFSRAAVSYPRKRAIAACQVCRGRKTKCDNERPSCGFCRQAGATCVYESDKQATFDAASLAILDRLAKIETRLDNLAVMPATCSGYQPQQPLSQLSPIQCHRPLSQPFKAGHGILPQQSLGPPRQPQEEKHLSRLATVGSTCQAILSWPIFDGAYDPDAILAPLFEDDSDDSDDGYGGRHKHSAIDVDEEELERYDLRHLIERFLTNVQTKNPILDQGILEEYVDEIERRGFDGSGESCIVLMVCALGAVSAPYSECFPNTTKSSSIYPDLDIGKKFFLAAKKRFGTAIIRNKLTTVQCLFLGGMYSMYTMQQFSGWKMFNSASVACQAYLMKRKTWRGIPSSAGTIADGRRKKRRVGGGGDEREGVFSEETQSFEKRIYWSCVKSENEVCVELETCTSGLSDLRYPHAFPSPPRHSRSPPAMNSPPIATAASSTTGEGVYPLSSVLNASSSPTDNHGIHSPMSNSANTPNTPAISVATNSSRINYHTGSTTANPQEDEITWFYYLAEIALRKIERKINEALHPQTLRGCRKLNQPTSDSEADESNDDDLNGTSGTSSQPRKRPSNRHALAAGNTYPLRPPPPSSLRAPTPVEMEELIHLTAEFETQLGIWYSYLPAPVKYEDLDTAPCRDERLQYLRGRCWKTKSDLYRPFLYHLIHHAHHIRDNYPPGTFARVAEFARKGLMFDMLAVRSTVVEHRHHGVWLTLRNATSGSLAYLAARRCGWFVREEDGLREGCAVIPEGCEEALEKTKEMLRWWGEKGARDAMPLNEVLCKLDEEWFGKPHGVAVGGMVAPIEIWVGAGMGQGRW